jgi:hypothetical protein
MNAENSDYATRVAREALIYAALFQPKLGLNWTITNVTEEKKGE